MIRSKYIHLLFLSTFFLLIPFNNLYAQNNNLETCLSGKYPSLCDYSLLTREQLQETKEAENRENYKICRTGKYPALCDYSLLTQEQLKITKEAEKFENYKSCLTGKYPSLCDYSLLTSDQLNLTKKAEKKENLKTCLTGKYPSLCDYSQLTELQLKQTKKAERKYKLELCSSNNYPTLCDDFLIVDDQNKNIEDHEVDEIKNFNVLTKNETPLNKKYGLDYLSGVKFYDKGDFNKALESFNEEIEKNPKNIEALIYRAYSRIILKDYKGALSDCKQILRIDKDENEIYFIRGIAFYYLENNKEALDNLNEYLNYYPDFYIAYLYRARTNISIENYNDAIIDINKYIDKNNSDSEAYYLRGIAKIGIGNNNSAKIDLNKAIQIDDKNALYYYVRGLTNIRLELNQDALKDYNIASNLNPEYEKEEYRKYFVVNEAMKSKEKKYAENESSEDHYGELNSFVPYKEKTYYSSPKNSFSIEDFFEKYKSIIFVIVFIIVVNIIKKSSKKNDGDGKNNEELPERVISLISMFSKMAKADGIITKNEVEYIDNFFKNYLQLNNQQRKKAIEVFSLEKDNINNFEQHCKVIYKQYGNNKDAINYILNFLFKLALIDEKFSSEEEILLNQAINIFGIKCESYEEYKKRKNKEERKNTYTEYDTCFYNYCEILGVDENADFSEIKRAYRELVFKYHPDKFSHLGEEYIKISQEQMKKINEAYDYFKNKYNSN